MIRGTDVYLVGIEGVDLVDGMNEIERIIVEIKKIFENDSSGHDVWHSLRVYKASIKISDTEDCDKTVVAVAALLHDVDDPKLFNNDNHQNARRIMSLVNIDENMTKQIINIIEQVSFKGIDSVVPDTIEGKIVQDADRLDAMGAIGIARAFAYGGAKGKSIYDPDLLPLMVIKQEDYISNKGTTINHFYEKLFSLKNMMNTEYAKKIAEKRDKFMREYITKFYDEWEGI